LDRLDDRAAELARLKVNVPIAEGTLGTLAAKRATSTIPIVMVYVADPVGGGLVASFARPGGNVNGLSVLSPGLANAPDRGAKDPSRSEQCVFQPPGRCGIRVPLLRSIRKIRRRPECPVHGEEARELCRARSVDIGTPAAYPGVP